MPATDTDIYSKFNPNDILGIYDSAFDKLYSNFFVGNDDCYDMNTIRRILERFQKNDLGIYGNFKKIPGLWFCKWINNDREKGYARGDFFWLNTEDIQHFINDNHKKIREMANVNPFVQHKLPEWKNNDSEIFDQYFNVLTGYVNDEMSAPLSALYELGNLSCNFQLIVSQKDNNKDPITNADSWKKFVVNTNEGRDNILFEANKIAPQILEPHVQNYHFGDVDTKNLDTSFLSVYADEDFSNVAFTFPNNYLRSNYQSRGFDCVDVYVKKPYAEKLDDGLMVQETWFRKWKSGFLEHGGIINVENYLNAYGDLIIVPFDWKFVDKESKFYQTDYIGMNNRLVEIDETGQIPPGDNLISVLHELESLIVDGKDHAPIYYSTDYTVIVTPIQQQFNQELAMENVPSYENLGNWDVTSNVLNVMIDPDNCTERKFAFRYDSRNTPKYYCYYVTGFCK